MLLSAESFAACQLSWAGQCTMAETGTGNRHRAGTEQGPSRDTGHCFARSDGPRSTDSTWCHCNLAPCTGDPVKTGKVHSRVYSEEDMAEKTRFRKHKTPVTFSFFHLPDLKTVKTKIRGIMWLFNIAQRISVKFQDISSMIHVHWQSL